MESAWAVAGTMSAFLLVINAESAAELLEVQNPKCTFLHENDPVKLPPSTHRFLPHAAVLPDKGGGYMGSKAGISCSSMGK